MSQASGPRPSSTPRSIMCASRGCVPSSRHPASHARVTWPRASSASSRCSSSRACASVAARRRIEPAERRRVGRAPAGQFERQRRQVGVDDLGRRLRRQRRVRGLRPQAITDARRGAAGAAAALVGRGARDRARSASRLMPEFGSKRWRRSSPASTTMRTPSIVRLVSARLVATTTLRCPPAAGRSAASCAAASRSPYSGSTSSERSAAARASQHRRISAAPGRKTSTSPGSVRHRLQRHPRRACFDRLRPRLTPAGAAADVVRVDVERAPGGAHDDRAVAEQSRDGRAVERGRHHQQAQVVAQVPLRVERQREAEVGLQVALVELVEDHAADVLERRIVLQQARQDAFGDDFDARRGTDARLEPRAIADQLPGLAAGERAPCAAPPRVPRCAAAAASGCAGRARARARRAAPAARPCSCRRPAAPRARHCGARAGAARSSGQRVEDRGVGQVLGARRAGSCDGRGGNVHDWRMEGNVWMWLLAALMVVAGLAGAVLPALPGRAAGVRRPARRRVGRRLPARGLDHAVAARRAHGRLVRDRLRGDGARREARRRARARHRRRRARRARRPVPRHPGPDPRAVRRRGRRRDAVARRVAQGHAGRASRPGSGCCSARSPSSRWCSRCSASSCSRTSSAEHAGDTRCAIACPARLSEQVQRASEIVCARRLRQQVQRAIAIGAVPVRRTRRESVHGGSHAPSLARDGPPDRNGTDHDCT